MSSSHLHDLRCIQTSQVQFLIVNRILSSYGVKNPCAQGLAKLLSLRVDYNGLSWLDHQRAPVCFCLIICKHALNNKIHQKLR